MFSRFAIQEPYFLGLFVFYIVSGSFLWAENPPTTDLKNLSSQVSYIYILGNTGESSGGHSALKIEDTVYHLQYSFQDKVFHIVRDPWEDFRMQYNVRENRKMYMVPLALGKESQNFLRKKWNEAYLVQRAHLLNQRNLVREEEYWTSPSSLKLGVRGAGYLKQMQGEASDILPGESSLKEIEENPSSHELPSTPKLARVFWEDAIRRQLVRYAMDSGVVLEESQWIRFPKEPPYALTETDKQFWENQKVQAESRLRENLPQKELSSEEEMDLFLKYLSAKETLSSGSIVLPNYAFEIYEEEDLQEGFTEEDWQESEKEAKQAFAIAYSEFQARPNPFTWNQWNQISHASFFVFQRDLRKKIWNHFPEKEALYPLPKSKPQEDSKEWEKKRKTAEARLQDLYPYHLIHQNCTSELLKYIQSFAEANPKLQSELGENLNLETLSGNFVPWIAFERVKKSYKNYGVVTVPSILDLYRESDGSFYHQTTIHSSIYRNNPKDSWFLLFTDQWVWVRPIGGMTNGIISIGETVYSTFALPFSRNKKWQKGPEGLLFSLPEFFFFNVRKGNFPYLHFKDLPPSYHKTENSKQ